MDVNENAEADVAFGDPVTATDPDSGTMLTYSLSGADAASFGIVESSGQLKTKGPLNYEGPQNVYDVIVIASDGSLTARVDVSIAVNDVKEAPGTPDAPTVEAAATDGHTELDVTWAAPSNTGPAIADYDVQYRVADSGDDFSDASYDGVGVSTTITDLDSDTTYEVQVRATNDEGIGLWSMSGEGTTSAAPNSAPAFTEGVSATRTVDENTAADVAIGAPVTATDVDGDDTLSYSLGGADAASFTLVESSGQLKTKASLDYETKSSYSVEVRADDGFVVESIAVTINVNDMNEAPVFPDGAPSLDVNENAEADVAFGDPMTATDPDSGAMLTYSLSGTDAASFAVVDSTGQLKTKEELNYEGPQNVYDVIVIASDGSLTARVDVSIAVNDVKEPPGAPDASVVEAATTDGHTSRDVTWTAPSNTGPAITDYDVQYRESGSGDDFTDASYDGVAVSTTITELNANTTYEVQVRATNDEGTGPWSMSGEGTTSAAPNNAPAFTAGATTTRAVDENAAADVAFDDPVVATDDDSGDMLSYSLSGTDAASFAVVDSSGQLKTKAALDYEAKSSYSVTLTARDGSGGMDSIAVTVNVNDVKEPPGTPDAPMVEVASTDGHTLLDVTWTAPSNTGPAITDYDVQYRVADSGDDFADASYDGVSVSTTITDLDSDTTYEVQVRATNDEGIGLWSMSGEGITSAAPNSAPTFAEGVSATRTVDENTAADVAIGDPVTATDVDGDDTLSYSLAGTDAASFAIVESSGQLKTKASLDYETKASYSVEVRADDGSVVESIAVAVNVNDVKEPPGVPDATTVEAATTDGHTSLDVTWTAPSNTGPTITDYDVQYRVADSGDDFSDASYDGVGVSTTITDLDSDTTYEVQVRATNDEGIGLWSTSGEGTTGAAPNNAPVFTEGDSASRDLDENTAADVAIGDPVVATDDDSGDMLSYSLAGIDAASFAVVDSSGQLKTKAALNYEAKASYSVTLTVRDGSGGMDSIAVSIAVNDVKEAPGTPDAPTVEAASTDGHTALDVTWTAPSNAGPPITDYDVQYRVADSGDDFTDASHDGVGVSAAITGLSPNTTYEVQVRATNDEGTGPWSMSGEGNTSSAPNNAPVFTEGDSASRDVEENTAADVPFGNPVAATDDDSSDTLSYSLGGADLSLAHLDHAISAMSLSLPHMSVLQSHVDEQRSAFGLRFSHFEFLGAGAQGTLPTVRPGHVQITACTPKAIAQTVVKILS